MRLVLDESRPETEQEIGLQVEYHDNEDKIVMYDGTEYYVCLQTIGLGPGNEICGGFDDRLKPYIPDMTEDEWVALSEEDYDKLHNLSIAHKIEIAEFMIKRWSDLLSGFKNRRINMSCKKGYRGECCCECENHFKIIVCSCESCSKTEGYICIAGHTIDKNYGCCYDTEEHGHCELFLPRIF